MRISSRLQQVYYEAKGNKWFHYFAVFCRITLAIGFIIAGIVKIRGERFASGLPVNNPMGHYLEALHQTEYYYTFIGLAQLVIALLLLFPRTALIGALMYFPIILNICILAYAVRFEGTRVTTFMVLANLYLLCWDFDRIKYILPFKQKKEEDYPARKKPLSNKFPFWFFGGVAAILVTIVYLNIILYDIRPGNSAEECTNGCPGNKDTQACLEFCDCIYTQGKTLDACLTEYNKALGH
ncbi:MAG: DoxX family protein [Saprospiraceae bacterium]|nr:DoxX family protein [Lewinella sp.]